MADIHYIVGDATIPQCDGNKIITHVCNDIGAWGAGFVLALSKKWKLPEQRYREWFNSKYKFELGNVQYVKVEPNIVVANMIGQHGIRSYGNDKPIRYDAVGFCLSKVCRVAINSNATVHMPRIGCGLAGGEWNKIEEIINDTLVCKGVDVYVYDLK